jgi:hypothetical protein
VSTKGTPEVSRPTAVRTTGCQFAHSYVQRLEIAEEKRLIGPWCEVVLPRRPGGPEPSRHASAEGPRPAASVGRGERPLGSAGPSWRRKRCLAPKIDHALRSPSGRAPLIPVGEVAGFAACASNTVGLLRETVVPSVATPSRGLLRVAQQPSNPAAGAGRRLRRRRSAANR